jgi:hypothetical protein
MSVEPDVIQGIFARLAEPFPESEVKTRSQGGAKLRYITARTARRRLNEVLGPAGWETRLQPGDKYVLCVLTIILPGGTRISREALGGYPKMPLEEDAVKGGDSDAFKRACACFGIAEYLYGDEVATFAEPRGERQRERSGGDDRQPDRRPLREVIKAGLETKQRELERRAPGEEFPVNGYQVERHLLKFAVAKQFVDDPGSVEQGRAYAILQRAYASDREIRKALRKELVSYLDKQAANAGTVTSN